MLTGNWNILKSDCARANSRKNNPPDSRKPSLIICRAHRIYRNDGHTASLNRRVAHSSEGEGARDWRAGFIGDRASVHGSTALVRQRSIHARTRDSARVSRAGRCDRGLRPSRADRGESAPQIA